MIQYKMNNNIYTVSECTINDIPSHIERVLFYWSDTNIDMNREYMKFEVSEHSTVKIEDTDNNLCACAYWLYLNKEIGRMTMLWFSRKPYAAMLADYARKHTTLRSIEFNPHTTIDKIPFRFGLSDYTVRRHNMTGLPLQCKLYGTELEKLHKQYFVNKIVEV